MKQKNKKRHTKYISMAKLCLNKKVILAGGRLWFKKEVGKSIVITEIHVRLCLINV